MLRPSLPFGGLAFVVSSSSHENLIGSLNYK
jgi:hypothetical protein